MTQRSLYQGPASVLRAVRAPRAWSLALWTALGLSFGVTQATDSVGESVESDGERIGVVTLCEGEKTRSVH